jgi:hypothetical protein
MIKIIYFLCGNCQRVYSKHVEYPTCIILVEAYIGDDFWVDRGGVQRGGVLRIFAFSVAAPLPCRVCLRFGIAVKNINSICGCDDMDIFVYYYSSNKHSVRT